MIVTSEKPKETDESISHASELVISYVREGYARGAGIPWFIKMGLKVFLSSLPVSYDFWKSLGIFKHGDISHNLVNLQTSFKEHVSYYRQCYGDVPKYCLELGPGDSIGHALSAYLQGIKGVWLIDVGDFATKDEGHYQSLYRYICSSEESVLSHEAFTEYSRDAILKRTGSHYCTSGLKSFDLIPEGHIDFSYSHAVLEHVRRDDFSDYMQQLYRVHKAGSLSRHWVDLHDHLGGALNSFRFSPKIWEGKLIGNAGFYTNRLTMADMVKYAKSAGFNVEIQRINKWKKLPTPRGAMHDYFKEKSEEELNVCTFLMVLEKART